MFLRCFRNEFRHRCISKQDYKYRKICGPEVTAQLNLLEKAVRDYTSHAIRRGKTITAFRENMMKLVKIAVTTYRQ